MGASVRAQQQVLQQQQQQQQHSQQQQQQQQQHNQAYAQLQPHAHAHAQHIHGPSTSSSSSSATISSHHPAPLALVKPPTTSASTTTGIPTSAISPITSTFTSASTHSTINSTTTGSTTTTTTTGTSASASATAHPLLTPSGRAFAVGGKVQNISSDPLSPCIMYWPDNEPFPEQGQIRPSCVAGIAQPPILNTGNRGPISHQPGDWICQKCNYLNWRRRKVCQTCLPYAEGNGDSISAAVQAERIALLTSVLSQTSLGGGGEDPVAVVTNAHHGHAMNPNANVHSGASSNTHLHPNAQAHAHGQRSHSLTPPQARRPFIDLSPGSVSPHPGQAQRMPSPLPSPLHQHQHQQHPQQHPQQHLTVGGGGHHQMNRPVHRSQSHFALGQQYHHQAQGQSQLQREREMQLLQAQQVAIREMQLQQQQRQSQSSHHQHQQQQQFQHHQHQQHQQQHQHQQIPPYTASSPIYQTSGHRQPSPIFATGPDAARVQQLQQQLLHGQSQQQHLSVHHPGRPSGLGYSGSPIDLNGANANHSSVNGNFSGNPSFAQVHAPAPLLPSFLQDMVQSPALSPTSTTTSSAELSSIEEYDEQLLASPQDAVFAAGKGGPRARGDSGSTAASDAAVGAGGGGGGGASPLGNIWRLDGEESKSLSAFPLPNHQELRVGVVGQERAGLKAQQRA
ncbi:hypothetical protein BDN70DRAFT_877818 [Pholiota conissans]|uniref:RanBP2-type domain-containing protein n=1 Tax=Pholiota conissans TaxID=109636 RepID=A0A9P6D248_9AGAR|nr:hypothetical protein BDN70DRAFT_877818 [Pholiota conissans]